MDTLWDFYRPSVQVGDDHVQLRSPQEKRVRDTDANRNPSLIVRYYKLTSSWISLWNMEWTPMMKGVGELRTSSSPDGRMGMYG